MMRRAAVAVLSLMFAVGPAVAADATTPGPVPSPEPTQSAGIAPGPLNPAPATPSPAQSAVRPTDTGVYPGPVRPAPTASTPAPAPTAAPTAAPLVPTPVPMEPGAAPTPSAGYPARPGSGYSGNPTGGASQDGSLAQLCRRAPDPELPGKSGLDVLAFGDARGDGVFSRYRFAGWGSHLYNPGCQDAAVQALSQRVGGTIGMVGDAATEEGGPNRTVNIILGITMTAVAVTYAATQLAYGVYPVWVVADQIANAARVTFGQAVLSAFLAVGIACTMLWVASRRRMDFSTLGTIMWRVGLIALLGFVLIAWKGSVGAQYDQAITGAHRVTTEAVTGGDPAKGSPADVVGDAIMGSVYMPLWGAAHLGWDQDAIGLYAERLHAASAFTVAEAAAVAGNESAYNAMVERKKADYDAVAAEIGRTHPAAKAQLDGKSAGDRVMFVALLLLAVLSIALVVAPLALAALAARMFVRVAVSVYPVVAAALQFPPLHKWGLGIPAQTIRWAVIGVGATAASVVVHRVVIVAALTEGTGSVFQRVAALTFVCAALVVGWMHRDRLTAAAGVSRESDAVSSALRALGDRIEGMSRKPLSAAREKFDAARTGKPLPPRTRPEPPVAPDPTRPPTPGSTGPRPAPARRVVTAAAMKAAPPPARAAVLAASVARKRGGRS